MAVAFNPMDKRDDSDSTSNQQTTSESTTSKKLLTYTLPTIYSAVPTTTKDAAETSTEEDPGQYHITLFTPVAKTSATDTTATPTTTVDPDAALGPTEYSVLVSRAPNEVTRSTKGWPVVTTSSASASASASATSSVAVAANSYSGLNRGQLAGVIVGSIAGGLFAVYLFYVLCWGRRKALRKARQERELREKTKHKNHARMSTFTMGYESDDDEKPHIIHHVDNQPVGLPRSQPQYDPSRVYYPTSRSDPKEDFRSYYRTSPNNTSNSSTISGASNTPLDVHNNSQPFYGGFSPYYRPMLHHQPPPAFVISNNMSYSGNSSPYYAPPQQPFMSAPPTMPVSANNTQQYFSPTIGTNASFTTARGYFDPEGFYQPQYPIHHSNAGSVASLSQREERRASIVSSVLSPVNMEAVLDASVDQDATQIEEYSTTSNDTTVPNTANPKNASNSTD